MNPTIKNFLEALNKIDERDYNTQRVKLVDENINIYEDTFLLMKIILSQN